MRRSPVVLTVLALAAGLLGALPAVTAVAAPATAAAAPVPTTPGAFVGLTPARLLDTRTGNGAPQGKVVAGRPVHLTAAGRGGVPADAAAVVLTLTVVGSGTGGYLTASPTGAPVPTASVLNWAAGQTLAGSATVTLGTGGALDLLTRVASPVDLVADVSGYLVGGTPTAAGAYVARTPSRLLDTRTGNGASGRLPSGATVPVQIAGRGGLPAASAMSAVVGTLTAVQPARSGYLTVWGGDERPTTSALNFAPGQVVANQVTVPLDASGRVNVYDSGGPVDVVLDVTGYVVGGTASEPGTFVAIRPGRAIDPRVNGELPSATTTTWALTGVAGVPATGVAAVVANLTVANPRAAGYLTVWPNGDPRPVASNLNWAAGATLANQATVMIGDGSAVNAYAASTRSASVFVDVSGYYLPALLATPTGLTATPTTTTVALHWSETDPIEFPASFYVRRAVGSVPPPTPQSGTSVPTGIVGQYGVTDTGLTPGTTYSYVVFAHDDTGINYGPPATVTVTTLPPDLTPPGPDTALGGTADITSVTLRWTPPTDADYGRSVVRWQTGTTAPASPTDGTGNNVTGTNLAGVFGLTSGTTYSFRVFARDTSGNVNPTGPAVTLTTLGTADVTGTTFPLPPDGIDPQKGPLRADCPPAGHCVALAWYYDEDPPDRNGLLMLSVVGDTGVTSYPVPLPSTLGVREHPYADVSCTSDTACVLVGWYVDLDGARVAFTGTWNGTVATTAVWPDASIAPSAVDCAAPGACTTVGTRTDATGSHPWVARLANGAWAEVPVTGTSTIGLDTVSCATPTSCAAVGGGAYFDGGPAVAASTSTGTSWTAVPAVAPTGAAGWLFLGPVTCPTAGTCFAAGRDARPGSFDTPSQYGAALVKLVGGVWSTEVLPVAPAATEDSVDIACGGGRCSVLVGDGSTTKVLSRPVDGGAWSTVNANRLPAGARTDTSPGLNSLACDVTGRCVAAGGWADASRVWHGYVAALSATQNSATTVDPSVPARLGGTNLGVLVCTDDGHCIATSSYIANTEDGWIASFRIVGGGTVTG